MFESRISHVRAGEVGPQKLGVSQIYGVERGSGNFRIRKHGILKCPVRKVGETQVRRRQICARRLGGDQNRMGQLGAVEHRRAQQAFPQIGSAQVRFGQIRALQVRTPQFCIDQKGPVASHEPHVHLIQVRSGDAFHSFIGPLRAARRRRRQRRFRQVRVRTVAH